ncbi:hypothetical protein IFM89_028173 [Coptis chinensis]|nr:hypothetical protein IFM89_028173 [Coptis chinensis]
MEFSSFSSGTERAVKTRQASLGAFEDGIMTAELLEKLFMAQGAVVPNFHLAYNVMLPAVGYYYLYCWDVVY